MREHKEKCLKKWENFFKYIGVMIWVLLCGIAVSSLRLVSWTFQNWGNLKADELVYTLTANLSGTNLSMVRNGILYCVPPGIFAGIVMLLIYIYSSKRTPVIKKFIVLLGVFVSVMAIIGGATYFSWKVGFADYIKNQNQYSAFIDENYVEPDSVQITFPEKKRNLIYLYIESMEISFSDTGHGGGKSENLIPELTELALEAGTFSGNSAILNGGYALYGSTYTMGGMFAQTTGLPLTTSHTEIQLSDSFMPDIVTLGDVLEDAGYHNILCIGTDAAFADRDKYFKEHGDYTLYDYNYSLVNGEIPLDYTRGFWGYDDHILYENAKKHLLELAKKDEPFNFTMLTVDTHAEDGYLCKVCNDRYEDQYSNVIACSSTQAADFVRWIQKQDFYENTTIVLAGDHCSMDSDFADDMSETYERRIYTVFLNPAPGQNLSTERLREYTSMDYFPSTLAALGVQIDGERLGLGTNLFSKEETLVEQYGVEVMNTNLAQKSVLLEDALGDKRKTIPLNLKYDDTSGSIELVMEDKIEYTGAYNGLKCVVAHKESGMSHSFDLMKDGKRYTANIGLQNFLYKNGEYNFDVYLILPDTLQKWCTSGSMNVTQVTYIPQVKFLMNENGELLDIIYRQEETAYPKIWFAVWSQEKGQDDLVWYTAEPKDKLWVKMIDLSMHTQEGNMYVHIYGGVNSPEENLYMVNLPLNELQKYSNEEIEVALGATN